MHHHPPTQIGLMLLWCLFLYKRVRDTKCLTVNVSKKTNSDTRYIRVLLFCRCLDPRPAVVSIRSRWSLYANDLLLEHRLNTNDVVQKPWIRLSSCDLGRLPRLSSKCSFPTFLFAFFCMSNAMWYERKLLRLNCERHNLKCWAWVWLQCSSLRKLISKW